MSGEQPSSGGEKTHDPTEKRLRDARQKGNIVKSADLSATAAYFGLALAFLLNGPQMVEGTGGILAAFLGRADELPARVLGPGAQLWSLYLLRNLVTSLGPAFLYPAGAVLLSLVAQRALVFAPQKLAFRLDRISPLSGLRNRLGPNGLFEFAKSLVKLVVISVIVALFLSQNREQVIGSIAADPRAVPGLMGSNLLALLWLVCAVSFVISLGDYLWQHHAHIKRLMMTRQEVADETKDSEGDPHMRQKRRQMGMDIATQRMMADVPSADVVIVNPEHYAVALKWDRAADTAPVCVAKGVDAVADRIREAAAAAAVPIHRDPPTARALFASVEVGEEVRPDHYRQVAAAIRFAERMRRLSGRRR